MRLVTCQQQSTSFDHIYDCLLRFLAQMTAVLNGRGATITSNSNPYILLYNRVVKGKQRIAEASRMMHCVAGSRLWA
jgi:hypothetical protein